MLLHPEWLNSINDPGMYPHPVSEIRLLETHISWVILTGDWAYKLKKSVNFGFVNFSTLELRQAACLEEVRLNRRTAPSMYDGVVPLSEESDVPQFGGTGRVLEYAVRMRQFAQDDLLEPCLNRHELSNEILDTLAHAVANLHQQAAIAALDSPYGTPEVIWENVQKCLEHLSIESIPASLRWQLKPLDQWANTEWLRLKERFIKRKEQGRVRECHGDLHLGNLVLYRGKPTLFDCLEFNPGLRWIDVISDVAFLVMDLCDKGAAPLAWRVLNEWLEQTGDYDGLSVLKYYLAYRALVRAKVAAIRLGQPELSPAEIEHQHELLVSYVQLALKFTQSGQPAIILMNGLSGSGKSVVARQLVSSLEAVQIRSDVERKRLVSATSSSLESPHRDVDFYTTEAKRQTYERLKSLAKTIVASGYRVIVDATFSKQADRADFNAIADELGIPLVIVACHAPEQVLYDRVKQRQQTGHDASDADINVLKQQLTTAEPLTNAEKKLAIQLDTTSDHLPDVNAEIRQRLARKSGPTLMP